MVRVGELIGRVLDGKYHLDKLLGQGGMGAVYLATHLGTKRPVALKVITPQFMANEEFIERFRREAEAAGRLRHPNVVNVTDFGFASLDSAPVAYLVMEYLDGSSLGDMLKKKGQMPLTFVVDIVEQICLAIGNAHEQGIIHRDLKPDNIWLQPDQRGGYIVKVLDFGLAKLRDASESDSSDGATAPSLPVMGLNTISERRGDTIQAGRTTTQRYTEDTHLEADTQIQLATVASEEKTALLDQQVVTDLEAATQIQSATSTGEASFDTSSHHSKPSQLNLSSIPTVELTTLGAVLGTPLYMSPEQCRGESLDPRSDIYSLGVIVYQMLAGAPPFTGDTTQLIVRHNDEPPPPLRDKRSDVAKPVATLVMSALAKRPEERPATAGAFADALRAMAEGESQLLRQAKYHYYSQAATFLVISLAVYIPFVAASVLLSLTLSRLVADKTPLVITGYWLAIILIVSLANRINAAGAAMILKQLRATPAGPIKRRPILTALLKRTPVLLATGMLSLMSVLVGLIKLIVPGLKKFVNHALLSSVVMLEDKRGAAALARSETLTNRLRNLAIAFQIREFALTLGSVLLMPCMFVVMFFGFGESSESLFSLLNTMELFATAYCWFFIIMGHMIYSALPLSLLYYRARQAGSEPIEETPSDSYQQEERRKSARSFSKGTLTWLILPLVMLAAIITISLMGSSESLMSAVRSGNSKAVKKHLEAGANANVRRIGGTTALMSATRNAYTDIIESLLAAGAEVNAIDNDGATALIIASSAGHDDIVKRLLAAGANVNARSKEGETALIASAKRGRTEAVKALLAAGADSRAKDKKGKAALGYAEEHGYTDTAQALKDAGAVE